MNTVEVPADPIPVWASVLIFGSLVVALVVLIALFINLFLD